MTPHVIDFQTNSPRTYVLVTKSRARAGKTMDCDHCGEPILDTDVVIRSAKNKSIFHKKCYDAMCV